MGREDFSRYLHSDFNNIVNNKRVDYSYLQQLVEDPDDISSDTPIDELQDLPKYVKYNYMIRHINKVKGTAITITTLDLHPMSAMRVATWLSADFGDVILINIKKIVPGMLCYSDKECTNIKIFVDKKPRDYKENVISNRLADEYNGCREVYLENSSHRIDVLTNDYIIEVKCYADRYSAIGQVRYYQEDHREKDLWIHLFDHNGRRDPSFTAQFDDLDIKLTYE